MLRRAAFTGLLLALLSSQSFGHDEPRLLKKKPRDRTHGKDANDTEPAAAEEEAEAEKGSQASEDSPAASAGEEVQKSGDPDAEEAAAGDATASGPGLKDFVVQIGPEGGEYPFIGVGGTSLFENGESTQLFRCSSGPPGAFEDEFVSVRRLELKVAEGSYSSMFGFSAFGSSHEEEAPTGFNVIDSKVRVIEQGGSDSLPTLHVAILPNINNNTNVLQVQPGDPDETGEGRRDELEVHYDCWKEGRATVEVKLVVQPIGGVAEEICLSWQKVCSPGWKQLEIRESSEVVFADGEMKPAWLVKLGNASSQAVTKLQLSVTHGNIRLRAPEVSSPDKFLKVEMRGSSMIKDEMEVGTSPESISVLYTCESDGLANVVLKLEKAVIEASHRPEYLEVKWQKRCGAVTFSNLVVFLHSDLQRDITKAVDRGIPQPGFARCNSQPSGATEEEQCPPAALEVGIEDPRTLVDFWIDASVQPPSFSPQPDVFTNTKVVRAVASTIQAAPPIGIVRGVQPHKRQMSIRYICLRDGVSPVVVTLHIVGHKPVDFVFQKRCVQPKVKVGQAFTAPQAVFITFFLFGLCGLAGIVACLPCKSKDEQQRDKGPRDRRGYDNVATSDRQTELPTRSRARPTQIGAGMGAVSDMFQREIEVMFH